MIFNTTDFNFLTKKRMRSAWMYSLMPERLSHTPRERKGEGAKRRGDCYHLRRDRLHTPKWSFNKKHSRNGVLAKTRYVLSSPLWTPKPKEFHSSGFVIEPRLCDEPWASLCVSGEEAISPLHLLHPNFIILSFAIHHSKSRPAVLNPTWKFCLKSQDFLKIHIL